MIVNKKNIFINKAFRLLGVVSVAGLISCQTDSLTDHYEKGREIPQLSFTAQIASGPAFSTRALTQTPEIIQANDFPGKFYIETYAPEFTATSEQPNPQFGTYIVPTSGTGGMLSYDGPIGDPAKPNWCNTDDSHYFWAWNVPWFDKTDNGNSGSGEPDPDDSGSEPGGDNGDDNTDPGQGTRDDENPSLDPENPSQPPYSPSRNSITLTLQDTKVEEFNFNDSTWYPGSWGNGKVLETFIGAAKAGPYDFRRNGPEVPLQFHHLVSKISLRSLLFYAAAGNTLETLKANITFVNMPTTFTFYPHPSQEDYEKEKEHNPYIRPDGSPIAVTDFASANPRGGLTFAFTNPDKDVTMTMDELTPYRDKFYICPEIDFSNVQFYVEILDEKYMKRGEYWGDFANVVFEREPGTDYDNPKDPDNPESYIDDSTILHAGEVMYFDLIVRESGGGGYRIYVQPWTERDNGPTKHYPHPGIYNTGDANDLAGTASDQWQSKFELYGDGFTDGKDTPETPELPNHVGIFHMYGDINRNSMSFPIGPGYVLDGMGYTLELNRTSETWNITIGNMIDIYIKVGEYTIYIDPNGVIYQYDAVANKYMPTGSKIDITDSKSSYSIDIRTGIIN